MVQIRGRGLIDVQQKHQCHEQQQKDPNELLRRLREINLNELHAMMRGFKNKHLGKHQADEGTRAAYRTRVNELTSDKTSDYKLRYQLAREAARAGLDNIGILA
jgi:hypothetical protein